MSAQLPRLHVYRNVIRGRIRNRAIDLVARKDADGYNLIIRSIGSDDGKRFAEEWHERGINNIALWLSPEAVEALRQVLNLHTQYPITNEPHE